MKGMKNKWMNFLEMHVEVCFTQLQFFKITVWNFKKS